MTMNFHLPKVYVFGMVMGFGFCAYTIFMWLTRLDSTYLRFGQYLDMAIVLLPIVVIFAALAKVNRTDQLSVIDRIGIAILISLISFLIYHPFLYMYHTLINPSWFDSVLALKASELKAANMDQTKIDETLSNMKTANLSQSGLFNVGAFVASVLVLPTLIALLSLVFIRKRKIKKA